MIHLPEPVPSAMQKLVTLVIFRTPQGISTANTGKLLNLVNRYKGETTSEEFRAAWDAICVDKFGRPCDLIGVTYAT